MTNTNKGKIILDMKDEGNIIMLLSNVINLIDLIATNFSNKARPYLIEHLVLSMRELSFFVEKYFDEKIDEDIEEKMDKIKTIRNAICHRSSDKNWLKNNIKIQGHLLFHHQVDDVEIQYGKTRIYLIKGIINLFSKFRKIFFDPSSIYIIHRNPYGHKIEETKLTESIEKLVNAIKHETLHLSKNVY